MAVCLRASRLFKENPSKFVFVAVLAASVLNGVLSAPANNNLDNDWWENPCTRPIQLRHGRSPSKDQFYTFIKRIDSPILSNLRELYTHFPTNVKHQPKGKCLLKVGNLMKPIKKAANVTVALQYFYATMIKIAQYMDKLSIVTPDTVAKINTSKRREIFEDAKGNLRLVMCEFYEELNIYENSNNLPDIKMPLNCLGERMDLVSMQLKDIDFFNKLKKYFNQSYKHLKKLKKRKGRKQKGKKNKKAVVKKV